MVGTFLWLDLITVTLNFFSLALLETFSFICLLSVAQIMVFCSSNFIDLVLQCNDCFERLKFMLNFSVDAPLERGRGSVNDQWVQEYQEFTEGEEKQSEWIDEYLDLAPQSKTGELLPASSLWAEEFLDFSEKDAVYATSVFFSGFNYL